MPSLYHKGTSSKAVENDGQWNGGISLQWTGPVQKDTKYNNIKVGKVKFTSDLSSPEVNALTMGGVEPGPRSF